jgi:hypothetical protein
MLAARKRRRHTLKGTDMGLLLNKLSEGVSAIAMPLNKPLIINN